MEPLAGEQLVAVVDPDLELASGDVEEQLPPGALGVVPDEQRRLGTLAGEDTGDLVEEPGAEGVVRHECVRWKECLEAHQGLKRGIARIMNSSKSGTVNAISPCAGL